MIWDHSGGRHHGPCTSKRAADGRISWRAADDKLYVITAYVNFQKMLIKAQTVGRREWGYLLSEHLRSAIGINDDFLCFSSLLD